MKRLNSGENIDTADATEVGSDCFPGSVRDERHYVEILFRLKNGAWLLVGHGGPMTKYASETTKKEKVSGRAVFLLSDQEAQTWIAKSRQVASFTDKGTIRHLDLT